MTLQMRFQPWPEEQTAFLSLHYLNMDYKELADKLQRSKEAIQMRASIMGLYRCTKLSIEDLQLIEALKNGGMSDDEIADKFDITNHQLHGAMSSKAYRCDICDSFSATKRSIRWQFSGEPRAIYSACPACCLAVKQSVETGNEAELQARRELTQAAYRQEVA